MAEPRNRGGTTLSARIALRRGTRLAVVLALVTSGVAACGGGDSRSSAKRTPTRTATPHSAAEGARTAGDATLVARGIPFPTNLAFDSQGRLWVSSGTVGKNPSDGVWYVPKGGQPRHVVKGLHAAFGLTWVGDQLYVSNMPSANSGRVTVLEGFTGSSFTQQRAAVEHVTLGQRPLGSIVEGPDKRMYVGVGAGSDDGKPPGRILSFDSGHAPVVEATGLNGAFGLAFHGRRLLVTDSGRNDLGPFRPKEEVNEFDPSGRVVDFGYPGCYGQGGAACAGKRPPLASLQAHSSPAGIAVGGDVAYVAENGSAFAKNPTGSDIVRVDLGTGHSSRFWRSPVKNDPIGVELGPDGDLYASLYASGKVVRFKL